MDDNEAIARYVMGWQMEGHCLHVWIAADYDLRWWEDEKHRSQIRAVDWHPDTNPSQALMVAEAMRGKKWEVRIAMLPDVPMWQDWRKYECSCELGSSQFNGAASNLESAIHAAAVQVARMMEAQNDANT